MGRATSARRDGVRRSGGGGFVPAAAVAALLLLVAVASAPAASGSAVAPPLAARLGTRKRESAPSSPAASSPSAVVDATGEEGSVSGVAGATAPVASSSAANAPTASSNPLAQLFNYVKDSVVGLKDGVFQMNADHRRCNDIRAKQRDHARSLGTKRPRGVRGIQTGGIGYEEYDFLRKGLVDRNKLFAVAAVSVCLPNYFVYYLWSFPDMMPSPFAKGKDPKEVSRERCHAVISTMLDAERGARVAPWTSKLNPFGRKATERAMERMGGMIATGCQWMEAYGATGSNGGRTVMKALKPQLYSAEPLKKQQRLLAGNVVPRPILKGLSKAIGADPLNKGSSPFGIGVVKHIESVTLADEFLVDQEVDLASVDPVLLAEACSARLIGGQGWTDDERREALASWLRETEVAPREVVAAAVAEGGTRHFHGNLARAALMTYNVVDGTRDARADSMLLRAMYRGQGGEPAILN